MKVLIADDSHSSRLLLERALQNWGYEVIAVADGLQAVARLADPQIELAIIDWMMPGLDGPSVCRHIQSLPRTVYTILLSGRDSDEDQAEALQLGASDYMVKPFRASLLRARLQAGERMLRLERRPEGQRES